MPLINQSIPTLVNGVSQQAPSLRLESQGEEQINGYSTIVEGLSKRPPREFVAKVSTSLVPAGIYAHSYERDDVEQYTVLIGDGTLDVIGVDGSIKTVTDTHGLGYLTVPAGKDAREVFHAMTVGDTTFICNRTVNTAMDAVNLSPARDPEALVFIKQASFSTEYKLKIDGTTASYSTPSTGSISTEVIASTLVSNWQAAHGASADFTITIERSVIWVRKNDGTDFAIGVSDGRGNENTSLVKGEVQRFSELPTTAPTGFVVQVVGDNTSTFDDYYVKFVPKNSGDTFGEGVWQESVAGGVEINFDAATMPHKLVRNSDGTFTFSRLEWGPRDAGDAESNPNPSFVGKPIRSTFFTNNRFGVLSGENIVMSRVGEFFEFFRETLTTTTDADPIDIASNHPQVAELEFALPFNEQVLVVAPRTQFSLRSSGVGLTTDSVELGPTLDIPASRIAAPVAARRIVFIPSSRGGAYTAINEYFVQEDSDNFQYADVTEHVPNYVKGAPVQLAVSPSEDVLAVLTDGAANHLYIYKFFWSGREKVQSAWMRWEFDADCQIVGITFIGSNLYLFVNYPDGLFVERVRMAPRYADPNTNPSYLTLLDRRVSDADCTLSYDAGTDETTITLPYSVGAAAGSVRVVTRATADPANIPGIRLNLAATPAGVVVKVRGDRTSTPLWIGLSYTFRYRFSEVSLKSNSTRGSTIAVLSGRLQLRTMSLRYDASGYFRVEVTPVLRQTRTKQFTGRILGSGANLIGRVALDSGDFRFPIASKSDRVTIDLINDSHLPCFFLSAEWEGFYTRRSQRG